MEMIVLIGSTIGVDVMLIFQVTIKHQEKSETIAEFPVKIAWVNTKYYESHKILDAEYVCVYMYMYIIFVCFSFGILLNGEQ